LDLQEFKNIEQDVQTKFEVPNSRVDKDFRPVNIPPCRLVNRVRVSEDFPALNYRVVQKETDTIQTTSTRYPEDVGSISLLHFDNYTPIYTARYPRRVLSPRNV